MRPKSMILILIALGCGLIASIGISQVIERGGGSEDVQMQQIYVAVEDIAIGEELTAQRVRLENWPIDRVPMGAITTAEQLDGKAPRHPLFAGEPLLLGKLADSSDMISAADRIKAGHRVMSVKVSMDTAVSHLIQPGDHVDILAFIQGRRGEIAKAETILENIEVFAINDQFSRHTSEDEGGSSIQAKTVSLQVTPEQANNLVYFAEQGRLRLTLRSPDDVDGHSGAYQAPVAAAAPVEEDVPEIASTMTGPRMEILDNSGNARVFAWHENDEEGLPTEITPEGGNNSYRNDQTPAPPTATLPPFQSESEEEEAFEDDGASERRQVNGFQF